MLGTRASESLYSHTVMMILDVLSCFFSAAARVPIEETVKAKKVEMKEEIPKKGTADMNVSLLQLCALSGKRKALMNLFICPLLLKSCFVCHSCLILWLFYFLICATDRLVTALSTVVAFSFISFSASYANAQHLPFDANIVSVF